MEVCLKMQSPWVLQTDILSQKNFWDKTSVLRHTTRALPFSKKHMWTSNSMLWCLSHPSLKIRKFRFNMLVTDPLTVNSVFRTHSTFYHWEENFCYFKYFSNGRSPSSNSSQFMCSIYELLKTVYNSYKVLLILDICIIWIILHSPWYFTLWKANSLLIIIFSIENKFNSPHKKWNYFRVSQRHNSNPVICSFLMHKL